MLGVRIVAGRCPYRRGSSFLRHRRYDLTSYFDALYSVPHLVSTISHPHLTYSLQAGSEFILSICHHEQSLPQSPLLLEIDQHLRKYLLLVTMLEQRLRAAQAILERPAHVNRTHPMILLRLPLLKHTRHPVMLHQPRLLG